LVLLKTSLGQVSHAWSHRMGTVNLCGTSGSLCCMSKVSWKYPCDSCVKSPQPDHFVVWMTKVSCNS
jgi:hypothetical protein